MKNEVTSPSSLSAITCTSLLFPHLSFTPLPISTNSIFFALSPPPPPPLLSFSPYLTLFRPLSPLSAESPIIIQGRDLNNVSQDHINFFV